MSMHAPRRARTPQPGHGELLDQIDYRFRLRGQGPQPLSVDGRQLGHGLPRRAIPLTELSAILMHPSCGFAARDAAWRWLVEGARTGEETWIAGAVGVALPGLRYKAYLLSLHYGGDVQSALVTEFVKALHTVEVTQPGVIGALLSTAFSKARAALRNEQPAASGEANFAPGSVLPPAPFGHPDFVLVRAVCAGVISVEEADMIGAMRLEGVSVAAYADRIGMSRWVVYKRRRAAEQRLVAAITSGELADPYADVVAEATLITAPEPPRTRRRP
ncbi:MAG: hypothetical protein ACRDSE_07695 [Pseudonocardiaceae bacterium]